jgi:hypothetical protein
MLPWGKAEMNIELHATGMKLPQAHARDLKQRLREAFEGLGVLLVRVFLKVADTAVRRNTARECMVEVHMADGSVAYVSERQRHLGALVRRAVSRAWSAVKPGATARAGGKPASHRKGAPGA